MVGPTLNHQTADGLKTYSLDGANRLVGITYSSTNNYTEFSYDRAGRRVRIQEVESGTLSSDKRFVWDRLYIAELRAADGTTVHRRFFGAGFQATGTSGLDGYFYVRDHLGSIRAVIDESGVERGKWNFGTWGKRSSNQVVSSSVEADFGYTGHYVHQRSGLVGAPFRFMIRRVQGGFPSIRLEKWMEPIFTGTCQMIQSTILILMGDLLGGQF